MSEDIRKWTEGRYTLMFDEHTFFVFDNEKEERMTALNVTKRLNEQQATISALKEENEQLKEQLKEMKEEERLYANEILELREINKEHLQFKELGGNY